MKRRHVAALLALAAVLGHAGQLHAQRPEIRRPTPQERYEDMRKSRFLAATLEWIVPTVGHDYAGDREEGLPMLYLTTAGLGVFFVVGVGGSLGRDGDCRTNPGWDCDVLPFVAMAGAATFVAGRVWASVSAWKLANRTNAFYRRRLNLDDAGLALSVTPGGQLGLGVSLRF